MTLETGRYISEENLATMLGISRRTLQRWRTTGDGPAYVRAGARRVLYPAAAAAAWAEARTFAHRAAEAAGMPASRER